MCYAVSDAGWVCALRAERECLAQRWEFCVQCAVGEPLFSGAGESLVCESLVCELLVCELLVIVVHIVRQLKNL